MTEPLRVLVLGPFVCSRAGVAVPVGGSRRRALLALLALQAPHPVGRHQLVDAIWGEDPPPAAVNSIQVHVSALRKLLGADAILTEGTGYRLGGQASTDVAEFQLQLTRAKTQVADGEVEQAVATLDTALELWRGDPLADLDGTAFAAPEAARLEELRLAAIEARAEARLTLDPASDVLPELQAILDQHPLREGTRGLVMLALYRGNRQADALAVYEQGRRVLRDELGLEPGPALRDLHRRLLSQTEDAAQSRPIVMPRVAVRTTAGPLGPTARPGLPVPASSFVGRETDVREVTAALTGGLNWLVTLVGPGGIGKTRLAIEAAGRVAAEFPGGLYWVGLAGVRDPSAVLEVLAQAVGLNPERGRSAVDLLQDRVAAAEACLVVLDNAEHLLPGLADELARLPTGGSLRLLVTSRERLQLPGERIWPVPALADQDGVALFASRARDLDPGFAPTGHVRDLCARLDWLPLAIELAASRTVLFSPDQILQRAASWPDLLVGSRHADPRQQTLQATLQWSYDLLTEPEQDLLCALSVFAGGCTYEAAEQVCLADPDTMQSLIDKSLASRQHAPSGPRIVMLQTVRDFAAIRLPDTDPVHERFLTWAADLAAAMAPGWYQADGMRWMPVFRAEVGNLRRALELALTGGRHELALRLVIDTSAWWQTSGLCAEGRSWVERCLARSAGLDTDLVADASVTLGLLMGTQGDDELAVRTITQALPDLTSAETVPIKVLALVVLSNGWSDAGKHVRAAAALAEAETLADHLGIACLQVMVLEGRAELAISTGDREAARSTLHAALEMGAEINSMQLATLLLYCAELALADMDIAYARLRLDEAGQLYDEHQVNFNADWLWSTKAHLEVLSGDLGAAAVDVQRAKEAARQQFLRPERGAILLAEAAIARAGGDEDQASQLFRAAVLARDAEGAPRWRDGELAVVRKFFAGEAGPESSND